MPRLVIENGPDKGRYVLITARGTVLIGRDTSAGLQLHDTMASRMHFKIEPREEGFWLVDMDSMNGTLLNGQPVRESPIRFGDLVTVGETLFSFVSDDTSTGVLTGQKIAGYRILERIGRGGMGTVYKAEQVDLQRIVALKVLSEENSADKEFIDLFVHEARAAAKLNHPNVVQIYDVKRQGHLYFFSMEYVPGGSVQDRLNRERKMPVAESLGMLVDAARGLEYAHGKGIVHRDVKPDNLMVAEDGKVKLGDLGLARRLDEKIGPEEDRSVIGTPHYIAPEQVLGKPADFRSDVYALGATAYRMLAGVTPFAATSIRELVNKKVREDPAPLHEVATEVPRPVSDAVHRMMARDPAQRHQTMAEVATDLDKVKRGSAGPGAEGTTTGPIAVSNRRLLVAALGMLILLLLGTVVAFVLARKDRPGPAPIPQPAPSNDLAERMLLSAKEWEGRQMDRNDPDSIRRTIREYQAVVDKYGSSSDASVRKFIEEAREAKARLEKLLRECQAALELTSKWEAEDVANWEKMGYAMDQGKYEQAMKFVDRTILGYHDFADREDTAGTEAAGKARAREEHILRWKVRVEDWRKKYDDLAPKVDGLEERKRYGEAQECLEEFKQKVSEDRLKCEFSPDRYRTLLFDREAERRQKTLVARAQAEFGTIEAEARKARGSKSQERYEAVLRKLDAVQWPKENEDIATKATLLKRDLEQELARWQKEEEDRLEKERRDRLLAERALFERASIEAHGHVLRYGFKQALASLKAIEGKVAVDPYGARLARRLEEMERVAALTGAIATAFGKGSFKKEFGQDDFEGKIVRFTDSGFEVQLNRGGKMTFEYAQFPTPAAFYAFVKTGWTRMDPDSVCCLVLACMEFGLYEEAAKELEALAATEACRTNPALKAFVERHRRWIADGESAESEEIECGKRLSRLEAFLKADNFAGAKAELDVLRKKYGRTETFQKAQKRIEDAARKISESGGEDLKRKQRSARGAALDQAVSSSKSDAQRRQADTINALNRVPGDFERNVYLGEMYTAYGEWSRSSERLTEAKTIAAGWMKGRENDWDAVGPLLSVYAMLLRNAILAERVDVQKQVRGEAKRVFQNERAAAWWGTAEDGVLQWQHLFASATKRLPERREALKENPEEPDAIWALAATLDDLCRYAEARGYYQFLLDNHPDHEKVQSGECLYRLAEILFHFVDVKEAIRAYRLLNENYPEHAAVKGNEGGSTKRRLEQCHEIARKMGLRPRDK